MCGKAPLNNFHLLSAFSSFPPLGLRLSWEMLQSFPVLLPYSLLDLCWNSLDFKDTVLIEKRIASFRDLFLWFHGPLPHAESEVGPLAFLICVRTKTHPRSFICGVRFCRSVVLFYFFIATTSSIIITIIISILLLLLSLLS